MRFAPKISSDIRSAAGELFIGPSQSLPEMSDGSTAIWEHCELRVATNAQKRLRIDYDSVTMSKNALGIWYESRTIFRIGEFVAKVLNNSILQIA